MKIDTSGPRLPLNRLKHPLKQKSLSSGNDNSNETEDNSNFSEAFERLILEDGARRFDEWLKKLEIK